MVILVGGESKGKKKASAVCLPEVLVANAQVEIDTEIVRRWLGRASGAQGASRVRTADDCDRNGLVDRKCAEAEQGAV